MSRDLILVAFSLVTWGIGEGMFILFQPLYLQELGADSKTIGLILGLVGVAMMVAHLPAGYLADRIGRRPLMLAAWIMGMISTWIMALASRLPVFVLGSALYGMTSFVVAPMNSYITAARGNWSVGRALTTISATYNVGAILGPLLGGWIGVHAGLRTSLLVAAVIFMLSTLIIFFIRPQPVQSSTSETGQSGLGELLNPRYLLFLLLAFLTIFSLYLPQPLSQNFLRYQRGVDLQQIGWLIAARSAGVVLLNLTIGRLAPRRAFLLAQVVMAFFALLIWQGDGLRWYFLGYMCLGGLMTARAMVTTQGRTFVKAANMGLAYGSMETAMAFAAILAPLLAGVLYSLNPTWIYTASLALIGLMLIVNLAYSPLQGRTAAVDDG